MYVVKLNESELNDALSERSGTSSGRHSHFSTETPRASTSRSVCSASSTHSKQSVPGLNAIAWTFDESEQREKHALRKHIHVDSAGMRNYYLWRRLTTSGIHPGQAANMIGSQFGYKQVKQKRDIQLFSIRLTKEHRVYFTIQEKERIVKILNIGGHAFG